MKSLEDTVTIKLEDGTFEENFLEDIDYGISILLNGVHIGSIIGQTYDYEDIHIELISIEEQYRGKGYGSVALEKLKEVGKSLGIKYIDGECRNNLKNFYGRAGAKFENREPGDEEYILNKFYIDL